jgi:KWG Leptospira.
VFADANSFSEGLAAVSDASGRWGYIDKAGEIVIDYKFNSADEFSDGLTVVRIGGKTAFIDKTGDFTMEPQQIDGFVSAFSGGIVQNDAEGLASNRYLDRMGKTVWPKD